MTRIGIYEKALPKNISWPERLSIARDLGFDFVEMSIDETDQRLARLSMTKEERLAIVESIYETGVAIHSICFSGQRRFPMGSSSEEIRKQSIELMYQVIDLAYDLGVRIVQLAGYDVYYEEKSILTRELFIENLKKSLEYASAKGVILSVEIMDDPFINSITKFQTIKNELPSPFLQVYPDLGNLSAWLENDVGAELAKGIPDISAIHLKDTLPVTEDFAGQFRDVPFGDGCVDFEGCLTTLKRLGYQGPFLIEMWSENAPNSMLAIEEAKDYLYPILRKVGYDV